jgi:hypothetical protein
MQDLGQRAGRMCKTLCQFDMLLTILIFLDVACVGTQVVDRGVTVG